MSMPWERYGGSYTSGWDNPKKKPAKKTAAKKSAAKKKTGKTKRR